MHSADTLQGFVFEQFAVRGYLVRLDASWRALIEHHSYPEPVRQTLGEGVAATLLLAATLKFDGQLILQVQGPGPMHLMVIQTTSRFGVRGVARFRSDAPTQDLGLKGLSGDGQLTVTVENQDRSSRYQGVVPLIGERFTECFEAYFERSEQLPTRLWLTATEQGVAGLLLQRLPSGASASTAELEHAVSLGDEDWNRVVTLAETVTPTELVELSPEELLWRLFNEEQVRLFDASPVFFQCACSRERVSGILRALGEAEVRDILAEQGGVEVRCEFCNRLWRYDPVDALGIFLADEALSPPKLLQ